jgi:predicted dithiol-disulfide oxidoreductase (DUF899 family)
MDTPVVSRDEWLSARLDLLEKERALTHARDDLARARRALPRVRVATDYVFDTVAGPRTLFELFDGRSQLLMYHFMFGPDWDEGCPSCSFWTDGYNGTAVHLAHRDVTFLLASRAPLDKLQAYRKRMGWDLVDWVSSGGSSFNFDIGVSFTPEEQRDGATYNYAHAEHPEEELPGMSVFETDGSGAVFHTYSCYSRGIDALNLSYQLLDLVPKGRDEQDLPFPAAWLRRHDQYD